MSTKHGHLCRPEIKNRSVTHPLWIWGAATMLYEDWGFRDSPFETTSLPATEFGANLLVGREDTVASLMQRISTGSKLSTVEGLNGVGKTSVVNVSAYRLFKQHAETGKGALFIPCRKIFQLNP